MPARYRRARLAEQPPSLDLICQIANLQHAIVRKRDLQLQPGLVA